jgi:hypothetical protein
MNSETVGYKQETVAPAKTLVNRDASQTRLIAGVSVPDGPLITAVIEHAQRLSEPYLFNVRRKTAALLPMRSVR